MKLTTFNPNANQSSSTTAKPSISWAGWLVASILTLLPIYYFRFRFIGVPTNPIEIMVISLSLFALLTQQLRPVAQLPYRGPIICILLGVIIAALISANKIMALGIVKGWFIIPALYYWLLLSYFDTSAKKRLLLIFSTTGLVFVSVYTLAQYLGWIGLTPEQGEPARQYLQQGRAIGFFESPNFLAMYLVPLMLLAVGVVRSSQKRLGLVLLLPLAALWLSGSRAGWLALVVSLAILGLVNYWSVLVDNRGKLIMLTLTALGLASVVFFFNRAGSDAEHILIWKEGLIIALKHPLLGIGPGQFQNAFAARSDGSPFYQAAIAYALHPHNIFLNFWLSGGLLALMGFIWLLVRVLMKAFTSDDDLAQIAGVALVAVLVHGLFDSTYFKNDLSIIFWLLIALTSTPAREEKVWQK